VSFFPSDARLFGPLFSDPEVAARFSDDAYVRQLVAVEVALAEVQGRLGVIPKEVARHIAAAAPSFRVDLDRLAEATERDGFPVIGLLEGLRGHVGGEAASFVHWGATTQDVMDTALVLQLRAALSVLEGRLERLVARLAALAEAHRDTLMAGRTHAQQALPITFGLKVATWLAPLLRHRDRLADLRPRLLVVQFGGAAGTLAALGDRGPAVQRALASELGLGLPLLPWHTQRDSLAEFAAWLSLLTGSLAKTAQDVILMAQSEVGELAESGDPSRGGSSTMPQKRNPVRSELVVAAARHNAALLGAMHQALIQEHERATHSWQLEWLALPQMVGLTGGALQNALRVALELQVDAGRMRRNVEASRGLMLAEAASFLLAQHLPRGEAERLVKRAVRISAETGRHLTEVLRGEVDLPVAWSTVDESSYLGAAREMVDAVLQAAKRSGV